MLVEQIQGEKYYQWAFDVDPQITVNSQDWEAFVADCEGTANFVIEAINDFFDESPTPDAAKIVITNKTLWLCWQALKLYIRVVVPGGVFIPLP